MKVINPDIDPNIEDDSDEMMALKLMFWMKVDIEEMNEDKVVDAFEEFLDYSTECEMNPHSLPDSKAIEKYYDDEPEPSKPKSSTGPGEILKKKREEEKKAADEAKSLPKDEVSKGLELVKMAKSTKPVKQQTRIEVLQTEAAKKRQKFTGSKPGPLSAKKVLPSGKYGERPSTPKVSAKAPTVAKNPTAAKTPRPRQVKPYKLPSPSTELAKRKRKSKAPQSQEDSSGSESELKPALVVKLPHKKRLKVQEAPIVEHQKLVVLNGVSFLCYTDAHGKAQMVKLKSAESDAGGEEDDELEEMDAGEEDGEDAGVGLQSGDESSTESVPQDTPEQIQETDDFLSDVFDPAHLQWVRRKAKAKYFKKGQGQAGRVKFGFMICCRQLADREGSSSDDIKDEMLRLTNIVRIRASYTGQMALLKDEGLVYYHVIKYIVRFANPAKRDMRNLPKFCLQHLNQSYNMTSMRDRRRKLKDESGGSGAK